ncbi:MAG: excinuclease ABC subunit UvrA [Bacteroidota bacterium]|nr:excinuclease ABC subunit UvrA [Bacteroidota bacterium]
MASEPQAISRCIDAAMLPKPLDSLDAPQTEKSPAHLLIRGARQHNLKNIDLALPRNRLIVFTGPSGSGKSSLVFDTIYAEGYRRYTESLSAYARQFLERLPKPDVDEIEGLSPAVAIEQKSGARNARSTVATMTELYDYLRLLFARIGRTYSPISGEEVTRDTPERIRERLRQQLKPGDRLYVAFPVHLRPGQTLEAVLNLWRERGFYRLLCGSTLIDTAHEAVPADWAQEELGLVVDRLTWEPELEEFQTRLAEAIELAYREGEGQAWIRLVDGRTFRFSQHFERDGMRFEEPTPQLFGFNSPYGACKTCQGFGRVPGIDPDKVIPDPRLSIREGAVAPWRTDKHQQWLRRLERCAHEVGLPLDVPYCELTEAQRDLLWNGWPGFEGIEGFFREIQSQFHKMHYRIFYARFRGYKRCPDCRGYRLRPEALYVRVGGLHIGEVTALSIGEAERFFRSLRLSDYEEQVAGQVLAEIRRRLEYLVAIGLDYLTLDRLAMTLSGGETQRIHLATALGGALVGAIYVLDEPSIGLHPRDTERLIGILRRLRDQGNTVLVVEHDPDIIRAADEIVELGPGAGEHGGQIVFQGSYEALCQHPSSLTGGYLSGRLQIPVPRQRRRWEDAIVLYGCRSHNLKNLDVTFPLNVLVCVTGPSGSGKSTLVHQTLYEALRRLKGDYAEEEPTTTPGLYSRITGHEAIAAVELVDQSPIGRSSRSNPVTFVKAFDPIRELYASLPLAQARGYTPGFFSFNVEGGRCEACQGEGWQRIEMQFLADLYLPCEVCQGRRYKDEVLDVRYRDRSIVDVLEMTVEEASEFFADHRKIVQRLHPLQEVGLGYVRLGQPTPTLSGGEAQRLKLAAHLAEPHRGPTLYLFDEPTTGLHLDDVRRLLACFDRLLEQGHSVVVIEHNLEVIKCADYVIDLGPGGGAQGGYLVATGTPEEVAQHPESPTGPYLRAVLERGRSDYTSPNGPIQ